MRVAGGTSWRFAEGIEQLSVVALYVRDALRLYAPTDGLAPPLLEPAAPDRSDVLDDDARVAAAAQWLDWWRLVLAHEVRQHQGPPAETDARTWARTSLADVWTLFDPPDFGASAPRPDLRRGLRATFDEALHWADAQRAALQPSPEPLFDYELVRTAAEHTVRRHGVDPNAVRACAVVLPVEGAWWHHLGPGAVSCSVHAATEPEAAQAVLTDAFESSLPGAANG